MAYVGKITDTDGVTGLVGSTLYGTCATAAATVAKVVTLADFDELMTGVTIHVKFTNSNTATNPTLNVNSTGAKSIYKHGTTVPGTAADTSWPAGSVVSFTYDGSAWIMNDHIDNTNTDTKVTQTAVGDTYTNYRPLVISAANNATAGFSPSTVTDSTFITAGIYCQPSTSKIFAKEFDALNASNTVTATLHSGGLWLKSYIAGASATYNYNETVLKTYAGKLKSNNGMLITLQGGGLTIVGGGESATSLANLIDNDQSTDTTETPTAKLNVGGTLNTKFVGDEEQLLLSSDNNIYFITACQTIANRKPVVLDTSSYFYPGTNNTGSIGTSTYRWGSGYFTTLNTPNIKNTVSSTTYTHTLPPKNGTVINSGCVGTGLTWDSTNNVLNHSNSVTAVSTAALLKVKHDAQGHITGSSAATSSDLPAHTHYEQDVKFDTSYSYKPQDNVRFPVVVQPLINTMRTNKFVFLPSSSITIEHSTDGGSTYTDSGYTDTGKCNLFTSRHIGAILIGPNTTAERTTSMRTMVTITRDSRYTRIDRFYIWFSTSGHTAYVDIQYATNAADTTWVDWRTNIQLLGWSGPNLINGPALVFGASNTHVKKIRFIFRYASIRADYKTSPSRIFEIAAYSDLAAWTPANKMMMSDHLYSWDKDQMAYFPAEIKVPTQLRVYNGNYGALFRTDGTNTHILLTNSGEAESGGLNSLRPFSINNSTGLVTIGEGLKINTKSTSFLELHGVTTATKEYGCAAPKIRFTNSDSSQNAELIWDDYDNYCNPASLSLIGNQAGTYFIAPRIRLDSSSTTQALLDFKDANDKGAYLRYSTSTRTGNNIIAMLPYTADGIGVVFNHTGGGYCCIGAGESPCNFTTAVMSTDKNPYGTTAWAYGTEQMCITADNSIYFVSGANGLNTTNHTDWTHLRTAIFDANGYFKPSVNLNGSIGTSGNRWLSMYAKRYFGRLSQEINTTRQTTANLACEGTASMQLILATSSMTSGKPALDGYILDFDWDNTGQFKAQLSIPDADAGSLQWRPQAGYANWDNAANLWRYVHDNTKGVGKTGFLAYPTAGSYYEQTTQNVTGALVITLPFAKTNGQCMIHFSVDIYNYIANQSVTYVIAGYCYNNEQWYQCTAYALGRAMSDFNNLVVRFGCVTGGKYKIQIGETTTVWKFPQVSIRDVTVGYKRAQDQTTYMANISDWTVTFESSDIANVTQTITYTRQFLPFDVATGSADANTYLDRTGWFNWNTTSGSNMPTTNYGILLSKENPSVQVFIPDNASGIYFRRRANTTATPTAWWGFTGTAGNTYNLNNFINTGSVGTGLSWDSTNAKLNHSNSITAGTAKGDDSKTLTFGGTFSIPSITYDAQGHITAKGTTTMTMPADPNKCAFVVDETSDFASYAWHKFAEVTLSDAYADAIVTFLVSKTWGQLTRETGILTAHIRTGSTKVFESAQFNWLVAGDTINPAEFVMVYTNTASTSCKVELWHKQTVRYDGWIFKVLKEHSRTKYGTNPWTLFVHSGHGSAAYTTGTGTIVSTLNLIANTAVSADKINTDAGSNVTPVYFSGGIPVAVNKPDSGAWFSTVPSVGSTGVIDIGRYIDFHSTNAGTTDYDVRLDASSTSLLTLSSNSGTPALRIAGTLPRLRFQQTTSGKEYNDESCGIWCQPASIYGVNMFIQSGGNLMLGAGEFCTDAYSRKDSTGETQVGYDNIVNSTGEKLYLGADGEVQIISNGNSIAAYTNNNHKVWKFGIDGTLLDPKGLVVTGMDKNSTSYWGMFDGDGVSNNWIRTTTYGFIPFEAGGLDNPHSSLGTSTWSFNNAYIANIYTNKIFPASGVYYNNNSGFASAPWAKTVDFKCTTASVTRWYAFRVYQAYEGTTIGSGLLIVSISTTANKVYSSGKVVWVYAAGSLDKDNFAVTYTNTASTSTTIAIWAKCTKRYQGWNVIPLYGGWGSGKGDIGINCYSTTTGAAAYTGTLIASEYVAIKNNAASADKINTDAGSTKQPVYFTGGVPTAIGYTIEKSVPSNAVFTDTKVNVTLGTTTKAYLLGTSTTPTSTAAAVTSIADTGVYLSTTAGEIVATTFNGTATKINEASTDNTTAKTYSIPFNTDPSTASSAGSKTLGLNSGLMYRSKEGTASAEGEAVLVLGNGTAKGTAGNKTGKIKLYSEKSSSYNVTIQPATEYNGSVTQFLPCIDGEIQVSQGQILLYNGTVSLTSSTQITVSGDGYLADYRLLLMEFWSPGSGNSHHIVVPWQYVRSQASGTYVWFQSLPAGQSSDATSTSHNNCMGILSDSGGSSYSSKIVLKPGANFVASWLVRIYALI